MFQKVILRKPVLSIFFFLCGCISGPKNDGRTFAEKMNGENYQSTNVIMGVPILERKPVLRKFSGHVYCGKGITQTPANHALVSLMREDQIIASTSTDTTGNFVISAPINPDLEYQLSANSLCGKSFKSLPKNLKNENTEEILWLQK